MAALFGSQEILQIALPIPVDYPPLQRTPNASCPRNGHPKAKRHDLRQIDLPHIREHTTLQKLTDERLGRTLMVRPNGLVAPGGRSGLPEPDRH